MDDDAGAGRVEATPLADRQAPDANHRRMILTLTLTLTLTHADGGRRGSGQKGRGPQRVGSPPELQEYPALILDRITTGTHPKQTTIWILVWILVWILALVPPGYGAVMMMMKRARGAVGRRFQYHARLVNQLVRQARHGGVQRS